MRFSLGAAAMGGLVILAQAADCYTTSSTAQTDALAANALAKLVDYAAHNAGPKPKCTEKNVAKRREWGSLSVAERVAYTNAVKCLMTKPSKFDPAAVPGAKSLYDDFVAVHINQTLSIHFTGNFLSWHRYFTWAYEQALRNECGYKGYQPYWNWGRWAQNPLDSPLFDGGVGSIGGNGDYVPHGCSQALPNGLNCIPPGTGGGCVTTGPFANMTANLGPLSLTLSGIPGLENLDPAANPYTYNPRCLRRDVSSWVSQQWLNDRNTTDLIIENDNIADFQYVMQGDDFADGNFGVHTAGHFTIGGDPAGDFFVSPGDPAFYLHHAQIDRVWWIWQNQKPKERTNTVAGTLTFQNNPPSRDATLEDIVEMEHLATPRPMKQLMSTVGLKDSPLCYVYI
ncbi:putative tyrosinase [Rhypophila decipiens]|uniref:Tyrosinase n=1 Tax=Rhypophila decipiens TaxID=261697 RepID=A0AAN6Y961_9PEZI|nr:putative tyrosinase [Rhypophila decipiens]